MDLVPNIVVNHKRNLFFDLDGTLADSREGIVNCIVHAFRELNEPIPGPDELTDCLGPPLWESLGKLLTDPTEPRVKSAIAAYRKRFNTVGIFENRLYPHVAEMLSELRRQRFALFVVTSKPRVLAERIIEHFGLSDDFRRVHGPELSDFTSTKANLIADVLSSEGIDQSSAVMVGDRRHDIAGAKAHGVFSVGACWGYGSRAELTAAGADLLADSPSELLRPGYFEPAQRSGLGPDS